MHPVLHLGYREFNIMLCHEASLHPLVLGFSENVPVQTNTECHSPFFFRVCPRGRRHHQMATPIAARAIRSHTDMTDQRLMRAPGISINRTIMPRYAPILFRASAGFKTPNMSPKAVTMIAIVARDPMIPGAFIGTRGAVPHRAHRDALHLRCGQAG